MVVIVGVIFKWCKTIVRKKNGFLAIGVTFRQALVIWCVVTKSLVTYFLTHGYRWLKRKCKSGGVILKMAAAQGEYILPIFPFFFCSQAINWKPLATYVCVPAKTSVQPKPGSVIWKVPISKVPITLARLSARRLEELFNNTVIDVTSLLHLWSCCINHMLRLWSQY